ncbi:MAG: hypothetical protein HKN87_21195 [Saprospiraceae bacterium]|nr:hypothetical protein [Saprospiraceae bacterium]
MQEENHFALLHFDFEQQFMHRQLPAQDFIHLAHLRLACLRICRDGIEQALPKIPEHLEAYCEAKDAANKFNLTLTVAAIKTVYHIVLKSQAKDFAGFIAKYPQLHNNFKTLIGHHYGSDIFNSVEAKTRALEPDLLPYDC